MVKVKDLLLSPFEFFVPPQISTPFSTIKLPPFYVTMFLVFVSFFVISGGAIFSHVKKVPFIGVTQTQDGRPVTQIIASARSQTWMESIIVGAVFTLASGSLITAYSIISGSGQDEEAETKTKKKNTKKKEEDVSSFKELFAVSFPLWILIIYFLFRAKYGFFALSFSPR